MLQRKCVVDIVLFRSYDGARARLGGAGDEMEAMRTSAKLGECPDRTQGLHAYGLSIEVTTPQL